MAEVRINILEPDKLKEIRNLLKAKGCSIKKVRAYTSTIIGDVVGVVTIDAECRDEEISDILKELSKILD